MEELLTGLFFFCINPPCQLPSVSFATHGNIKCGFSEAIAGLMTLSPNNVIHANRSCITVHLFTNKHLCSLENWDLTVLQLCQQIVMLRDTLFRLYLYSRQSKFTKNMIHTQNNHCAVQACSDCNGMKQNSVLCHHFIQHLVVFKRLSVGYFINTVYHCENNLQRHIIKVAKQQLSVAAVMCRMLFVATV